jgi:hypothetical protein
VNVVVSPEAEEYVRSRGGVLFVRSSSHRCCGGALTVLDSTTEPPADATDFQCVESDGIVVKFRGSTSDRPHELTVEIRGVVRRRPVAYWDGCAFKP